MVKLTLLVRMAVSHNLSDLKGVFMHQTVVTTDDVRTGLLSLGYQALIEIRHDPVVRIDEAYPFSHGFP